MVCTSLAPSLNANAGSATAGGATAGGASTAEGGATAVCTGGGAVLGVSAGLGGSTLGSTGLGFSASGFFCLGARLTVISFSRLPSMPSRPAKKNTANREAVEDHGDDQVNFAGIDLFS